MGGLPVILILALGSLATGVILFVAIRWLLRLIIPSDRNAKPIETRTALLLLPMLACLVIISWYLEAGNQSAVLIWGAVYVALSVLAGLVCVMRKRSKNDDGA